MLTTPGLFDLQINGFAGVDFNDAGLTAEALDHALEAVRATGVTGCLPTLISAPRSELERRLRALDRAVAGSRLGPRMVPGYHLEGPFLNAGDGYRGCHPAEAMTDPSSAVILHLEKHLSRPILLVTLAPERPGAVPAIEALTARGKVVAVGHSAAGYGDIERAAAAGLSLSTHLGNGLPKLLPKLDNTLLAQLACPALHACVLADGVHVPPDALRALVALKGTDRTILVTDAVSAASAPPGDYDFAGMRITLHEDGSVRQGPSAHLAGAALCLDQAVRNVVLWGIADAPTALAMASRGPLSKIAPAFAAHRIEFDPGTVSWDDNLRAAIQRESEVRS